MILPFLLALLAFLALLPILSPLLRGSRPVPERAVFDRAVYRDQLEELDRDVARGLITPTEADAARLEIQRRLLAAGRQAAAPVRLSRSPVVAAIVFVVIAAGSVSGYLWLGAPGIPDEPYSAQTAAMAGDTGESSLQQAADTLAAKLKQNPSDASGWLLYGRSLATLRQWDKAENAYRHAIDLGQSDPDVLGDHGEIMVMAAAGTVTPAAEAAFQQVLKADPNSGIAHYYLAVAAMQAGEPDKAIAGFQAVLAQMPADSPLRAQLGQKIAEAAKAAGVPVPALAPGTPPLQTPGPDAKAMADAAAMPDDRKQAMIEGMVAQLAAKQAADPSNLEGWLRLGKAYAVLHRPDDAADAYDRAARLKPDDMSIPLQEIGALLGNQTPSAQVPPRAIALLKRVEAIDPEQPLVLWYLGMVAAQDAHADEARLYWGRLLAKVPPGGDEAKAIQSALDTLPKPLSKP